MARVAFRAVFVRLTLKTVSDSTEKCLGRRKMGWSCVYIYMHRN